MIWLDGALVRAEKPSFGQGRNPVNRGHGDMSRIAAVGDDISLMDKSVGSEIIVATPAIGRHGCPVLHNITDKWHQARTRRIRDTTHAYVSEALGRQHLDIDGNKRLAFRSSIGRARLIRRTRVFYPVARYC
jgi:hypothetical protein